MNVTGSSSISHYRAGFLPVFIADKFTELESLKGRAMICLDILVPVLHMFPYSRINVAFKFKCFTEK